MPKPVKSTDEEVEKKRRFRSLTVEDHPLVERNAADTDDLARFEVAGIVYARHVQDALKMCSDGNLGPYMSAAVVIPPGVFHKPVDHGDRLQVAKRYSRWHLGSEGWARCILEAYEEPGRIISLLDEEEGE